mgnify:CR=1 FL=1
MKKLSILFFFGLLLSQDLFGQQVPQFSQYIFNGLHINPAYAGYKNEGYVQSTYRSQWVGFDGAPVTQTLTLHTPLMSHANAISGVVIIGAIIVMGRADADNYAALILGFLAVVLGAINVVGGFVVTDRMLEMFKKKK